jgi:hypothetical protein
MSVNAALRFDGVTDIVMLVVVIEGTQELVE